MNDLEEVLRVRKIDDWQNAWQEPSRLVTITAETADGSRSTQMSWTCRLQDAPSLGTIVHVAAFVVTP